MMEMQEIENVLEENICRKKKNSILTRSVTYNKIHVGIGRCQLRFVLAQETIVGLAKS